MFHCILPQTWSIMQVLLSVKFCWPFYFILISFLLHKKCFSFLRSISLFQHSTINITTFNVICCVLGVIQNKCWITRCIPKVCLLCVSHAMSRRITQSLFKTTGRMTKKRCYDYKQVKNMFDSEANNYCESCCMQSSVNHDSYLVTKRKAEFGTD